MNNWILALACCVINILIQGGTWLSPMLFVASMDRYRIGRTVASIPYSLCYFVCTVEGPIIGYFGEKYGLRAVTLCGCILSALGIGACFFAEDIIPVIIFWGGVYGAGNGLGTALLPAILNTCFEKNKSMANGLSMAGSSLGGIVTPPMYEAILKTYGVSGSYLIYAVIVLNSVPAAMLLALSNSKSANFKSAMNEDKATPEKSLWQCGDTKSRRGEYSSAYDALSKVAIAEKQTSVSGSLLKVSNESNEKEMEDLSQQVSESMQRQRMTPPYIDTFKRCSAAVFKRFSKSEDCSPVLLHYRQYRESECDEMVHLDYKELPVLRDKSFIPMQISAENLESQKSALASFRIFRDPTFLAIMLTNSLQAFVINIYWTILIDVFRDKGFDQSKEVYFMMVQTFVNMVACLGLGWIVDGDYISKTKFSMLCFLFVGLCILTLAFTSGYVIMMVAEIFIQIFSGGLVVVFPGIIDEFVDNDIKTLAIASRFLLLAPLSFTISPLIGYFRETLGSYDGLFFLLSGISLLCCFLESTIPALSRYSSEKRTRV